MSKENGSNYDNASVINDFAQKTLGISVEDIRKYPAEERAGILRRMLTTDEEIEYYIAQKNNGEVAPMLRGIALIKPELADAKGSVLQFFQNLGCDPQVLPSINLSHEQWMAMYADRIKDFPQIMFLYVTQRALGVTPVLFNYPKLEDYQSKGVDLSTIQITDRNDLAEVFNTVYCGHAFAETPGTIRWEVVRPALESRGFEKMTGPAAAFDPFHYFRTMPARVNFGAFNGIHLPDNSKECVSNMKVLLGDIPR